jgi:Protein of unknown function (DUF3572)
MRKRAKLGRDDAEAIGLQALVFLTAEPSRLSRFLDITGVTADRLRAEAGEPHMLAAILSHILEDESLLLVFAAENALDPEAVGPAVTLLGSDQAYDRSI